jgi:hypothetical protein
MKPQPSQVLKGGSGTSHQMVQTDYVQVSSDKTPRPELGQPVYYVPIIKGRSGLPQAFDASGINE